MKRMKIKVEKHTDRYIAYPVGLEDVIVGEGSTREDAIEDVKEAIRDQFETIGEEIHREYPEHILVVMGIVRNSEGDILLIRNLRRGWEPPTGQVENGENVLGALEREVRENSGILVKTGRLIAIYSNVISNPTKLTFTFEANVIGGELRAGVEDLETGWFSPEEAVEKITHPAQKQKLQDALLESNGIIYRVYGTNPYKLIQTFVV